MYFTINDFQNEEVVSKLFSDFNIFLPDNYRESANISEIIQCKQATANFWKRIFSVLINYMENKVSRSKIKNTDITDFFEYKLIKEVFANSNLGTGDNRYFYGEFPYLELLQAIRVSNFQWYSKKLSSDKILEIFETLENIESKGAPFSDDRFRAVPVHTAAIKRGFDYSVWLQDEIGGFIPHEETERYSSSFRNNYIDSKYGLLIFFKNKQSILVLFLIDEENNLYIHQIQSQVKDRGHYKLGANWREEVIKYIESLFPDHNTHIIDGKTLSDMVYDSYTSIEDDEYKPSQELLDRIEKNYNELRPTYTSEIQLGNINYRAA